MMKFIGICTLALASVSAQAPAADTPVVEAVDAVTEQTAEQLETLPTLADIINEKPTTTTFNQLLKTAGLQVALSDTEGSELSVYTPSDEAFTSLSPELLDLISSDTQVMTELLYYHIVPGVVDTTTLEKGLQSMSPLLPGEQLIMHKTDTDTVVVNGGATVTEETKASNGVVRIIDSVLIPQSIAQMSQFAEDFDTVSTTPPPESRANTGDLPAVIDNVDPEAATTVERENMLPLSINDYLASRTDLSQLAEITSQIDITDTLPLGDAYTIFAPIDSSFQEVPATEEPSAFIKRHIVRGVWTTSELQGMTSITTIGGEELPVEELADGSLIVGGAQLLPKSEQILVDGIVHPVATPIISSGNMLENNEEGSSFVDEVKDKIKDTLTNTINTDVMTDVSTAAKNLLKGGDKGISGSDSSAPRTNFNGKFYFTAIAIMGVFYWV